MKNSSAQIFNAKCDTSVQMGVFTGMIIACVATALAMQAVENKRKKTGGKK